MIDLSQQWPLGLGQRTWWVTVLVAAALVALALIYDHQLSVWAVNLPASIRTALAWITPYGESNWVLYPSAVLFVLTAGLAFFVRWKLMRTLLWQMAELYAFFFVAVGLPSLVSTLAKRVIGRPRPMHFNDAGLFGLQPNWLDWTYQSMPSGHATTAFAFAAAVGAISGRWFYPALAWAIAIGLSRIVIGVHYPSDVLVGGMLGIVGSYAVRRFFAQRGWGFEMRPDGSIHRRPLASLRRYVALKRRGAKATA